MGICNLNSVVDDNDLVSYTEHKKDPNIPKGISNTSASCIS